MEMTKHLSGLYLMLMSYSIVVYMSLTIIHTDKNHSMSSLPLEASWICYFILILISVSTFLAIMYMRNTDFKKFRKCNKE